MNRRKRRKQKQKLSRLQTFERYKIIQRWKLVCEKLKEDAEWLGRPVKYPPCPVSGYMGDFSQWIFPQIMNMPENGLVDHIVGVQPMQEPVAQIVYLDIVGQEV